MEEQTMSQERVTYTAEKVAEALGHVNHEYAYSHEAVYSEEAYRADITLVLSDEPLDIDGQVTGSGPSCPVCQAPIEPCGCIVEFYGSDHDNEHLECPLNKEHDLEGANPNA